MAHHTGPHREAPGSARRQRQHGEVQARVFAVIFAGRNERYGVGRLRLARWKNLSRLLRMGAVLTCLVPGLGAMRAQRRVTQSVKAE